MEDERCISRRDAMFMMLSRNGSISSPFYRSGDRRVRIRYGSARLKQEDISQRSGADFRDVDVKVKDAKAKKSF